MASKVEEKKKKKQEALLTAAFDLFTAQGINNTSISDIAKKAKMAKGTFYLYFKDKFDIRDKLITSKASLIFTNAEKRLELCQKETLEDRVMFIANDVIDQLAANPILLRFISKNLSWAVFSNIRIYQLNNKNCMDIFSALIEESGRKFRNSELMIYMIVELISSTCYNVILQKQPVTVEELKPELLCAIVGILHQFECTEEQN